MANDGLQRIMSMGVVISGDDKPVTQMGAAEGIMAFASWLDRQGADGTVSYVELGRAYFTGQGWQMSDPGYRGKLQPEPNVPVRAPRQKLVDEFGQTAEDTGEMAGIPVTAPVATIIDGENIVGQEKEASDA